MNENESNIARRRRQHITTFPVQCHSPRSLKSLDVTDTILHFKKSIISFNVFEAFDMNSIYFIFTSDEHNVSNNCAFFLILLSNIVEKHIFTRIQFLSIVHYFVNS